MQIPLWAVALILGAAALAFVNIGTVTGGFTPGDCVQVAPNGTDFADAGQACGGNTSPFLMAQATLTGGGL